MRTASAQELAAALRAGTVTARDAVQEAIERVGRAATHTSGAAAGNPGRRPAEAARAEQADRASAMDPAGAWRRNRERSRPAGTRGWRRCRSVVHGCTDRGPESGCHGRDGDARCHGAGGRVAHPGGGGGRRAGGGAGPDPESLAPGGAAGEENVRLLRDWDRFRSMLAATAGTDVLVTPAAGDPPAWRESGTSDCTWTLPWNLTGAPAVVPRGGSAVQVIARPWEEAYEARAHLRIRSAQASRWACVGGRAGTAVPAERVRGCPP